MPKSEQVFYFAVREAEEKRRNKEMNNILKSIAKMLGAKVRS